MVIGLLIADLLLKIGDRKKCLYERNKYLPALVNTDCVKLKRYETRGWATKYRGLISIHNSKKVHFDA